MTDQTVPQPPAPDAAAEPDKGGRGKGLAIGGGVVALALIAAGGAFAYSQLGGGGTQPQDVLPADVAAFVRLDADPSAAQKIALFKLIRNFPEAADEIGIKSADTDPRKLILDEVLSDCDVDYDDDVAPWIGDRIGIAATSVDEDAKPIVALQVTDEDAAREGIPAVAECIDLPDPGIAFTQGYAIVAESEDAAKDAVADAEKAPLADREEFANDMDDLGETGVASFWADASKIAENPDFRAGLEEGGDAAMFDEVESIAGTLRASSDTLELAAIGRVTDDFPSTGEADLGDLPANSVIALSAAGGGDSVAKGLEGFGSDPEFDQFLAQYGFNLSEDLPTLVGDRLDVVAGDKNIENLPAIQGPADLSQVDVGLRMTSDAAKAKDLAQRLADLAARYAGVQLVVADSEDGAVLATNQEIADALAGGDGGLGDEEAFSKVVPDDKGSAGGLFVDVAAIVDALEASNPPAEVSDVLDQLGPLQAVGASSSRDGDVYKGQLRIGLK